MSQGVSSVKWKKRAQDSDTESVHGDSWARPYNRVYPGPRCFAPRPQSNSIPIIPPKLHRAGSNAPITEARSNVIRHLWQLQSHRETYNGFNGFRAFANFQNLLKVWLCGFTRLDFGRLSDVFPAFLSTTKLPHNILHTFPMFLNLFRTPGPSTFSHLDSTFHDLPPISTGPLL